MAKTYINSTIVCGREGGWLRHWLWVSYAFRLERSNLLICVSFADDLQPVDTQTGKIARHYRINLTAKLFPLFSVCRRHVITSAALSRTLWLQNILPSYTMPQKGIRLHWFLSYVVISSPSAYRSTRVWTVSKYVLFCS